MSMAADYMQLPRTRWYVFASQGEAVFFRSEGRAAPKFVARMKNSRGRKKEGETHHDRQGRVQSKFSTARHALGDDHSHQEHDAEKFASGVVSRITKAWNDHQFEDLVLVAEPRFLGRLRDQLPQQISAAILHEVHKEIRGLSEEEAASRVAQWRKEDFAWSRDG